MKSLKFISYSKQSIPDLVRTYQSGWTGKGCHTASVEGGQVSHAPPMNELELAVGGAIDILQQIALTLQ